MPLNTQRAPKQKGACSLRADYATSGQPAVSSLAVFLQHLRKQLQHEIDDERNPPFGRA
jgi:hypothetical protein